MLQYEFFRLALLAVVIIAVAAAMIGTYIISRRLVALSGGVTHACFGGLGLGYFLGVSPIAMAAVFAIGSSLGVEWLSRRLHVREDSAIAVVWALGMAVGVIFVFLTPGYVPELNSFLFGSILTVSGKDIAVFAAFTVLLILFFACRYRQIVAVAFDRDFARVAGLPVRFISVTATVMTAVCIVLTIRLVGIMLLMSMMTLPMMIAEVWLHRFGPLMVAGAVVSVTCSVAGLFIGTVIDVPCSAIIVLLLCAAYLASRIVHTAVSRTRSRRYLPTE